MSVASRQRSTTSTADLLGEETREVLTGAGVAAAGWVSRERFWSDATRTRIVAARGWIDEPRFTFRGPERAADPFGAMPWAQGAIAVALAAPVSRPVPDGLAVAGYAAAGAYRRLRAVLGQVRVVLAERGVRTAVLLDGNAAFDRALARAAGLGWVGRHSLIMVPGAGGAVVLGAVASERVVSLHIGRRPMGDPCRHCRRCVEACPTGAIHDGVVEPLACRAWRQQELRVRRPWREQAGAWLYGCDECLLACPLSARLASDGAVDAIEVLGASDEELQERVRDWYVPGRSLWVVRRNALIAARDVRASPGLRRVVARRLLLGAPGERTEAVRWWLHRAHEGEGRAPRAGHQRLPTQGGRDPALPRGAVPADRPDDVRGCDDRVPGSAGRRRAPWRARRAHAGASPAHGGPRENRAGTRR